MASLDYAYRRLVNTLGPERVARSEFERMVYSHDFASLPKIALLQWRLYPDFVALPQTTEEVAGVVKLSDESLLQITPRGGGTGWCGGSVPNRGGVLIDMRKMNHILGIDPDGRTVSVETGVSWKDVEDFVEAKGFALPNVPLNAIGGAGGLLQAVRDAARTPYRAAVLGGDDFVFGRALHSDTQEPVDLALVGVQGSKDAVAEQGRALDAVGSKEGGPQLPPAVGDGLW